MHLTVDAVFPQIDKECGIRNDIALEADPTALLDDSGDFWRTVPGDSTGN